MTDEENMQISTQSEVGVASLRARLHPQSLLCRFKNHGGHQQNSSLLRCLLLVLPGLIAFLPQSLVLSTNAFSPLTEKTDLLTLNLVFANILISTFLIFTALSLKFVPQLYPYIRSGMFGMLCFGHPL
uniref:Uncharacterized protein n=1 Tax=Knipowitschia caucasica TaxID=637954 RepID=A0AAV2LSS5_KNICA